MNCLNGSDRLSRTEPPTETGLRHLSLFPLTSLSLDAIYFVVFLFRTIHGWSAKTQGNGRCNYLRVHGIRGALIPVLEGHCQTRL